MRNIRGYFNSNIQKNCYGGFTKNIRGCSYEKNQPGKTGCLGLPRSRLYYQFLIKIFELSYEKRAGPANRDLALFSRDPGKTGCFFLI